MPKYKFMPDTPASFVIEELRKPLKDACGTAATFIDAVEKANCKTCMELAQSITDERAAAIDLSWHGKDTHPDIRRVLINKIKEPMLAFSLYISLSFLTDEEDKLLEKKFRGILVAAEQELVNGIVTRAKGK